MPARLTTRCRGEGAGEPSIVAAKSFEGKLPTPSLLSGLFSDGRAGASCISASSFIVACAVQGWQAGFCWYCTAEKSHVSQRFARRSSVARAPRRKKWGRNPAVTRKLDLIGS